MGFYEISSCFYTATASNTEYSILSFAFCAVSAVLQRQLDRKSDFSLLPHRSRNTAMVLLHNAFCNRKSQAIAAFFPISCFIQSVESLKQMLQILLLHRRYTAVAHHQACPISVLFQVDQNFPLWFTIFTGVIHQDTHHFTQPAFIRLQLSGAISLSSVSPCSNATDSNGSTVLHTTSLKLI